MTLSRRQKKIILRIAAAILLSAAAWTATALIELPFPIPLAAFLVPYAIIGYDVAIKAVKGIFRGQLLDENFLMLIASAGALALGDYPEAVFVLLFYQIGETFQDYAVEKSRNSIAELMDICADTAYVERDGSLVEISPEELQPGDEFIVRAGEKIATDGIITDGRTTLDTSKITGESVPLEAGVGDEIKSGCINRGGVIRVRATQLFENSTAAKITQLVESMSNKKAQTERFITRFSRYYTPVVTALAVLLAVVPPLFDGAWSVWVERALIFLVVSCPCALVISVPMTFFGGIGCGSKNGILIKGACCIEQLSKCETAVFDKTGTLTKGNFTVTEVYPCGVTESELLYYAAHAESLSNHPISASLKNACKNEINASHVTDAEEIPGHGISAVVDGKKVCVGNAKLMKKIGVDSVSAESAGTAVYTAIDGKYAGCIIIADEIKPESAEAVQLLKKAGVKKTVMLTGDRKEISTAVADKLGIDEVKAELLPSDKTAEVEKMMKNKHGTLAFVGDGINDAPVIMLSDVGIAMGALGSDAAIEAADVVLTDDNPKKIGFAIALSKKTMSIVWQNIIFSLAVKVGIMILGAFGLAGMWAAVFGDVGVCFIAILNAMRALGFGKK